MDNTIDNEKELREKGYRRMIEFLKSLNSQQSEEIWTYLDSADIHELIDIIAEKAMSDPEIKKRQEGK